MDFLRQKSARFFLFFYILLLIANWLFMRIFRYAFRNIIRNPFLSLSSIFVITLLIFFVNVLLLVLFASEKFIAGVNNHISFTINFQSGYTLDDLDAKLFVDDLKNAFSWASVTPITKKEAFEILKVRNPDLANLVENTWENPLPDSIRIDDIPIERYDALDAMISAKQQMIHYDQDAMNQKLLDYKSQFARISFVVKLLYILEYGVFALLALFFFTVAVIIYTVISNSIFYHENEIAVISLVGGKPSFIYGPFLLQGCFYAIVSMGLVTALIIFLRSLLTVEVVSGPLANIESEISALLPTVLLYETIAFIFLAMISSLVALSRSRAQ